jgi:hypothetical protein
MNTNEKSNSFVSIYNHSDVNDVFKSLQINQVILNVSANNTLNKIEPAKLKKVCWLLSILAGSDNDIHKQKADDIAKLLFLQNPESPSIATYTDIILRRTGNLPAIKHLKELSFAERNLDVIATQEAIINKFSRMVKIGEEPIFLSEFQRRLWDALNKNKDVLISGPTSSGKSFIVQTYLLERLYDSESLLAIYVVPSRALINQVVEGFRSSISKIKHIEIRTSFEERKNDLFSKSKSSIFVVTPERCIKLLEKGHTESIIPDFIFIDEIQNADRDDERALLYDILINESKQHWPNIQLVLAGPYISNLKRFYHEILPESAVIDINSGFSPVVHNYVTIQPNKFLSHYQLTVWTNSGQEKLIKDYPLGDRTNLSKSKGAIIARVVSDIANTGPNLIYCAQSNLATEWALEASKVEQYSQNGPFVASNDLLSFISFLKTEFHPDYYLASCLSKGIAYHHSRLPDIVRLEIEDLFTDKSLKCLYCTSTLLEGVNLPALNIFITTPKKKDLELSTFEFGNLKGRAGRISKNLQGSVYCVEIISQNEEGWSDKYMNTTLNYSISSRYSSSRFPAIDSLIPALNSIVTNIEERPIARFILHLRNKFIRDPERFYEYLAIGYPDESQREDVFNEISNSINGLSIPKEIILKNPSIDPLLQNALYEALINEGIFSWVIHECKNLFIKMSRSEAETYPINERPFFFQLEHILKRLDQIFHIYLESRENTNESISISKMALHTARWIAGEPYRLMIKNDIKHYSSNRFSPEERKDPSNPKDINSIIGRMIKINAQVVTFVVVKYIKLLVNMLEFILGPDNLDYNFTLTLPAKIELGTSNNFALELIINGVPRSIAVEIIKVMPKKYEGSAIDWLTRQTISSLRVHPVYIKHLIKLGFLK